MSVAELTTMLVREHALTQRERRSVFIVPDPRIDTGPVFTPDGKALAYTIRQKEGENIWIQPLDGSRGHQITHFASGYISGGGVPQFAWSPDGKRLAVLRSHTASNIVLLRAGKP